MPESSLGARIAAARREAGLTQAELADVLGVSEDTIANYESGRRQPRMETLRAIAVALDTTAGRLVDDEPRGVPA